MKKQFASITIIILLLLIVIFGFLGRHNTAQKTNKTPVSELPTATLKIKDQILKVELANTPQAQEHGLSDRASLAQDHGMLFDFTNASEKQPEFWMKDMHFNLDFIWIANNKIIGMTANVPAPKNPSEPLPTYSPPGNIDYELEVNAGWSKNHNVLVGDTVEIIKD